LLYAVPFDRFDPHEHREVGIGLRLLDGFFNREVNALKVVTVVDGDDIPAQRTHGLEVRCML
jgi:hypothetical protein